MPYPVVVIGAGFGGIGMEIALKQAGIEDFVVVDRADDLGGTWRDNSYPGLACDVCSVGQLGRPALPDIVGRDEFAGPSWHSARWNHDVDLAGQRGAVVGTGASARPSRAR